jgi:Polyketide cyclase / dehydrase and lipid transport
MATLRSHARIQRSADDVWAVVARPERIREWFPGVVDAAVADGVRTMTLRTGMPLVEDIVTVDHHLRRFQYRVTGPIPVAFHLATVDVIDDHPDDDTSCLLVYSTEIDPEPMAFVFDGAIADAVATLARMLDDGTLQPDGTRPPGDPDDPSRTGLPDRSGQR